MALDKPEPTPPDKSKQDPNSTAQTSKNPDVTAEKLIKEERELKR